MTPLNDDILDDPFHGAAFAAYVEQAVLTGGSPCPEATRRLAYRYYEEALAERSQSQPDIGREPNPDESL